MLRVFAPADGPAEARRVAKRLRAALAAWVPVESCPPLRYWKIPQWYEHTLDLSPPSAKTFDAVVALAASGWTHVDRDLEFDSVWNAGRGCNFLLPEVKWAQLQRMQRGPGTRPRVAASRMSRSKVVQSKHLDGSLCSEGTASVPRRHTFCCDAFAARAHACYFDVRYEWWPRQRGWFNVITPEAGGGGIAMRYCPHCGSKLGGIARTGRYFPV